MEKVKKTEKADVEDHDHGKRNFRERRARVPGLGPCVSANKVCQVKSCGLTLYSNQSLRKHYQEHVDKQIQGIYNIKVNKKELQLDERTNSRRVRKLVSDTICQRRHVRQHRTISDGLQNEPDPVDMCPVCNALLENSSLAAHLEDCLKADHSQEEEDYVEVDDEDYEEYEWAGQTRIRATSLYRGGLQAAGFMTIQRTQEDEELDVLGDDVDERLGPDQYSDQHIIPLKADTSMEELENRSLREAVLGEEVVNQSSEGKSGEEGEQQAAFGETTTSVEQRNVCKVCLESYSRPLVSVVCWHVYCEQCWLRSLGAKKLCPQCKEIVRPQDLRKLFL